MPQRTISTDRAPAAVGPYSQGILAGGFLFTAMQIALDPGSGEMVGADAAGQTRRCLENIRGIVEAAGGSMADVVKVTVYLTDMGEFHAVNEAYAQFFRDRLPARGVIEASALPKGALVALEAVAHLA